MSKLREIGNKIFKEEKTELSSYDIELGLTDDFKKASNKAINSGTNAGGDIDDWVRKLPKLISALKTSLNDQNKVISLGNKIKKQVKEIGIEIPKYIEKESKGAEDWAKELKEIIKKANNINF